MASIEKRITSEGKTTFRAKIRLKGTRSQSATFSRLTDARKWVQQTESAIRDGRYFKLAEAKRHTLGEAIDRYVKYVLPAKPKSQYTQLQQLSWWKEQLGHSSLANVSSALIAQARDKLAHEKNHIAKLRSHATVNRYLAALSHVFTTALKEWGWVEDNPVSKVTKLKEPRGRVRYLEDDERTRLLNACKNSESKWLYLITVLALSTGARKMEILSLKWSDVNLLRGNIKLHETKNNERRQIALTGLALNLMNEHYQLRNQACDLVFPGKNLICPVDIRTPWETALKRANITNYKFHDNRHSAASYLAMNGASLAEIAEILGHKTLQMVKRYSHLSESHTSKVVASMNAHIFQT